MTEKIPKIPQVPSSAHHAQCVCVCVRPSQFVVVLTHQCWLLVALVSRAVHLAAYFFILKNDFFPIFL